MVTIIKNGVERYIEEEEIMVTIIKNGVERYIEENEVAHRIDENINYYVGSNFGYDDCWMFKWGTLSNRSQALHGLEGIEREIGVGILSEIKTRAIDTIDIGGTPYYVVPEDEVIDVYETYEHNSAEMVME